MPREESIRDRLRTIIDPDLNKDIVTAGLLQTITIVQGKITIDLQLTTPACPYKETFKKQVHDALIDLSGVQEVVVTMGSMKSPAQKAAANSTLKKVASIIAIASCKGGVGKSTVAALLACEMAQRGHRVGLLDTDIFGPSAPTLFDKKIHGVKMRDKKLVPLSIPVPCDDSTGIADDTEDAEKSSAHDLKIMSFGWLLGDAPAVMRGAMVTNYITQLLHQVDWGELDYLFLDLPPGTGDTVLTITQSLTLSGAVIVTTPAALALADVERGIRMLAKVNVPILGFVSNMASFQCPSCSASHPLFATGEAGDPAVLEGRLQIKLLASLPFISPDQNISFAPYVLPPSFAPSINSLTDKLARALGQENISAALAPTIETKASTFELSFPSLAGSPQAVFSLSFQNLRGHCPCALCQDEFTGKRKITGEDIDPKIQPTTISPVGNYAFAIHWSDGHQSGIYSYTLMKAIGSRLP